MYSGYYELVRVPSGQYQFQLKTDKGELILCSERYASKASAENGILSVQLNAACPEQYEHKQNSPQECYFVLKSKSLKVIASSQGYPSNSALQIAVNAAMLCGCTGKIVDLTTRKTVTRDNELVN